MSEHTGWCLDIFATLAEGGVWGVPRSGLLFQKTDGKLILIAAMPYDAAMSVRAEDLTAIQEADYQAIKDEFALAGITVEKKGTTT